MTGIYTPKIIDDLERKGIRPRGESDDECTGGSHRRDRRRFRSGIRLCQRRVRAASQAVISIFDFGFIRSDAFQLHRLGMEWGPLSLDDHLDRFARNAAKLRMTCPDGREEQMQIIAEALRRTGLRNAYVQMIMTRGRPRAGVRDPRRCVNQFFAFCRPYLHIAPPNNRPAA